MEVFFATARRTGFSFDSGAKILDFGCGSGGLVVSLVARGYDAFGYDIRDYRAENAKGDLENRFLFYDKTPHDRIPGNHEVDWNIFKLPYADNSFDIIISDATFEHVMNHDFILKEFSRVLKQNGFSINPFANKYQWIEPHIEVPLGSIFQNKTFYYLMAMLGFRNIFQKGLTAKEVADSNEYYMRTGVNYPSNKNLLRSAGKYFECAYIDQIAFYNRNKDISVLKRWLLETFSPEVCLILANKKTWA